MLLRTILRRSFLIVLTIQVVGATTPAQRNRPADPNWYDYEQVGRAPTLNRRPARDKIRAYEQRAGSIFSDRPVTRRRDESARTSRDGSRRRTTTYRPVADMLAPELLAQTADGNPQAAFQFYVEALQEYRRGMVEQGWPTEDVAAAIALYLNNHYTIVFGNPMPPGVPYAFYEIFREILMNDEDFLASHDRERQVLAESLAILATAIYSQHTFAQGAERERIRRQARANLESFTGQTAEELRDMVYAIQRQL